MAGSPAWFVASIGLWASLGMSTAGLARSVPGCWQVTSGAVGFLCMGGRGWSVLTLPAEG